MSRWLESWCLREHDYFVLKPKHSGFYASALDVLLSHLGAERLILTGFAGDICVLYTANDAFMRDYQLWVPRDCIASEKVAGNKAALQQMAKQLRADISPAARLRFDRLAS